jgi:hypothetical protein
MSQAQELAKRAVEEDTRAGEKGSAGEIETQAALRQALMGNLTLAKREAEQALNLTNGEAQSKYLEAMSAIAFGLAGDSAKATQVADDLERRFPKSTLMNCQYLPLIRGAVAMKSGNPAKAIEAFSAGDRCELGGGTDIHHYRIYLRGVANLMIQQGGPAATEFQKILDHPGLIINEPMGALAHLGLGRLLLFWFTNIQVFALWYWRLDAGGPHRRDSRAGHPEGAFLFPQMTMSPEAKATAGEELWTPNFVDYLFLTFNTSIALSPTDVPVLARWAKVLMILQAMISHRPFAVRRARCEHSLGTAFCFVMPRSRPTVYRLASPFSVSQDDGSNRGG